MTVNPSLVIILPMKRLPLALVIIFFFLFSFLFFAPKANNALATTKTLTASADAMIKSEDRDRNFGGTVWLAALRFKPPQTDKKIRSLVKFGLSSIPSNASVTSATFSIYFVDCGETYSQDIDDLNIALIEESWTEGGVTWNSHKDKFDMSGALYYSAPCDAPNKYLNYNVKTYVKNWLNGSQPNYGIGLYGDEYAGVSWIKNFYSKEHSVNKPPKLSVTYTAPSGTDNGDGTTSDETSDTEDEDSSDNGKDKVATDSATISAQKATPSTTLADKAKGTSGWKIALLVVLIILLAGAIAGYIIYRRKKKLGSKKDSEKTNEEKEETNPQIPPEK